MIHSLQDGLWPAQPGSAPEPTLWPGFYCPFPNTVQLHSGAVWQHEAALKHHDRIRLPHAIGLCCSTAALYWGCLYASMLGCRQQGPGHRCALCPLPGLGWSWSILWGVDRGSTMVLDLHCHRPAILALAPTTRPTPGHCSPSAHSPMPSALQSVPWPREPRTGLRGDLAHLFCPAHLCGGCKADRLGCPSSGARSGWQKH